MQHCSLPLAKVNCDIALSFLVHCVTLLLWESFSEFPCPAFPWTVKLQSSVQFPMSGWSKYFYTVSAAPPSKVHVHISCNVALYNIHAMFVGKMLRLHVKAVVCRLQTYTVVLQHDTHAVELIANTWQLSVLWPYSLPTVLRAKCGSHETWGAAASCSTVNLQGRIHIHLRHTSDEYPIKRVDLGKVRAFSSVQRCVQYIAVFPPSSQMSSSS